MRLAIVPPLAFIAAIAPVLGCSSDEARASSDPEEFNILVVVLDALRADKLGCQGFERDTSPRIDALAQHPDAVVFSNHHSQGDYTKLSTASLFTGLYAFQHGVVYGHSKKKGSSWRDVQTQILAPEHRTMAERLGEHGFWNFGVVKSRHLVAEYGFDQGFDHYVSPADVSSDLARADAVLDAIDDADRRFFGYVHFSAVHHPYPADERDPDYMKQYGFAYDEVARKAAGVDFTTPKVKDAILSGKLTLEPDDARFLNLAYEATLRYVDRELLGTLVDGLKKRGLFDSTMIVLTSDHGEELYDHEGYAHAHAVWEEVTHVPLIVKFPKGARPEALPDRVTDASQTIDLLPSLLTRLGAPPDDLPGQPIFDGASSHFVFTESRLRWALLRKGWKLIHGKKGEQLYDLRSDPGEQHDVFAGNPELVAEMNAFARVVLASAPGKRIDAPVIATSLDEEAIQELKQLGYIK